MIVGKYKPLDPEKLQFLKDLFLGDSDFQYHRSNTHQQHWLGNLEHGDFWKDHKELYDYVEKNTYPEDLPIHSSWFKLYTDSTKQGTTSGEFIGLHQDKLYEYPEDKESLVHTTAILLHRSEDASGGYTVLAGDDVLDGPVEKRFKDTRDIMSRLKVVNLIKTGETCVWNGWTMHGISEMESGTRLSLIIFKKEPFSEDYFKNGQV